MKILKKITCLFATLTIVASLNMEVFSQGENDAGTGSNISGYMVENDESAMDSGLKVTIDGEPLVFPDAQPFIDENGRTLVPIRPIAEALGLNVGWDDSTKSVSVIGRNTVSFVIGENKALVNGEEKQIDTAAVIIDSRTFVPLRFLAEHMDTAIEWYAREKRVNLWLKGEIEKVELVSPEKEAERRKEILDSLCRFGENGSRNADVYITYEDITVEEAERRKKIIEELRNYPYNLGAGRYIGKGERPPVITYDKYHEVALWEVEAPKNHVKIATAFMELENNVDYRTITEDFMNEYRFFFKPTVSHTWYVFTEDKFIKQDEKIQRRFEDIKNHKIIQRARFITDETLFYAGSRSRVRGRLEVYFESASPEYLSNLEANMRIHTGENESYINESRVLNLGKWYYCDVEINLTYFGATNHDLWEHSLFQFRDLYYLSEFKPVVGD